MPTQPVPLPDPDGPERIRQLLDLQRLELAEAMARKRLAAHPRELSTHLALAEALGELSRHVEAVATAESAVGLALQSAPAHHRRAYHLSQNGQLDEAIAALHEVLRLHQHAFYFSYQAQLLLRREQHPAALAAAKAGLRLEARYTGCLLWHALAHEALSHPQLADQDFQRLLALAPGEAVVHDRLGQTLLRRYQATEAARHLAEALRLEPRWAPWLAPLLRQAWLWQDWPRWQASQQERYRAGLPNGK